MALVIHAPADQRTVIRALEFMAYHSTVHDRAALELGDNSSAPLMTLARRLREQQERVEALAEALARPEAA